MKMKKLLSAAAAIMLSAAVFAGCGESAAEDTSAAEKGADASDASETSAAEVKQQDYQQLHGSNLSLDENGDIVIKRNTRSAEKQMGSDGTWTIFVYMCGSNLESDQGSGTSDISEMIAASTSDKVKFVVETGGSTKWLDYGIASDKLQRYVITGGEMKLADEQEIADMGDAETLADFLSWGVQSYPAANMGVVLWNHGGGSISGVCFDDNSDSDSLSLTELDSALSNVDSIMSEKFEFVGFDACLMATIETANMLVPHANYMFASEQTESGYGWDYTAIGSYLDSNSSCGGDELGKTVADSFYASCENSGEEANTTFSITDLSKVDGAVKAFNTFSQGMYEASKDSATLGSMVRNITKAKNYGGNSKSEGYTNMVDLCSLAKAVSDYVPGASELEAAVKDCVIYNIYGDGEEGSNGLTIYYPLGIGGSQELSIYKDICASPYYMTFVDKIAYGASNGGILDDYSGEDTWLGDNSEYWSDDDYVSNYWNDSSSESNNLEQVNSDDSTIYYEEEPALDDNGTYSFTLTQDSINNTAGVYCSVFLTSDDGQYFYDIGKDNYVDADWDTGKISDCFDGQWYMLGDGQLLAVYVVDESDDYCIMTAPILLNGELTNLRIMDKYATDSTDEEITILGVWDGIDENGSASRETIKLKDGDVITPVYDGYDADFNYIDVVYGDEYSYSGDSTVYVDYLPAADYNYAFEVDDIYGNAYYTPYVVFSVDEDGKLSFVRQ